MNEFRHLTDDPRLTAFALGELDAGERAAIEAQLQASPTLRDAVHAIRTTAAILERALASEAAAAIASRPAVATPARAINGHDFARAAILPGKYPQLLDGGDYSRPHSGWARVFAFPQLYYIAGGLAAAGFAVVVALQRDSTDARERARLQSRRVAMEQRAKVAAGHSVLVQLPSLAEDQASAGGMTAESERMGAAAPTTGSHAGRREDVFLDPRQHPVSVFPIKVDTASYASVRRYLEENRMPPADAVQIEGLVNHFSYDYPAPVATAGPEPGAPVAASIEVAGAPWAPAHRLVRIGLKGREVAAGERPEAGLVFILDVAGSMAVPNRRPPTIAQGVKVQVEFNPARVASYRLIGNEKRGQANEEFTDEDVAAGEIGAGHTVTALYEIVPVGAERGTASGTRAGGEIEGFRYQSKAGAPGVPADIAGELLTVKLRYKDPTGGVSRRMEFPLVDRGGGFAQASADFRFAAAVAEFGMILRRSPNRGTATLRDVLAWPAQAAANPADNPDGERGEFLDLVRKTQLLME